jgi:hypothetical protein
MVTPWSTILELANDEVQLLAEQYLGMDIQAMAGLRRCTCSRDDRLVDLTQVGNSYHALGCTRANPGKRAHWQLSRHMTAFINANTTCDASLEPRVGVTTGQRADVKIETPTADAKTLYVDISTTCAALHFSTITHTSAPVRDFRDNLVPPSDLPLHAARCREQVKVDTYGALIKARGGTFAPYVLQTSGGIAPKANHVLRLIRKFACRAGCSNPDGLTYRFVQEQACIQARCNAHQVRTVRDACRGAYQAHRHDPTWLPAHVARDALRPFR